MNTEPNDISEEELEDFEYEESPLWWEEEFIDDYVYIDRPDYYEYVPMGERM